MAMAAIQPATVCNLMAMLEPFGPMVVDEELAFVADPPADIEPSLRLLHTGVRAQLVGKKWYGCDGETGYLYELNPVVPLPENITLLCVEGDTVWDRIRNYWNNHRVENSRG